MSESFTPLIEPPPEPADAPARELTPTRSFSRLLARHNPFYLLSAMCMLASCLALTNSLSWSPIALRRLITLIITVNVYEAALLAIALFLVARKRLHHDGRMLLVLQAFFLADIAFLNAEIVTVAPSTGIIVNIILFGLAVVKISVVMAVLRLSMTAAQVGFALAQVGVLFALPCVLKMLDGGSGAVGARHLYLAWWITALLPAAYELLSKFDTRRRAALESRLTGEGARTMHTAARAYMILPYVSLLAHLGILHYVYDVRYSGAHLSPLLLGLALLLGRFAPSGLASQRDIRTLRGLLPLAAVLVCARANFVIPIGGDHGIVLTPRQLAIAGAFVLYVYNYLARFAWWCMSLGVAAAAIYHYGPSQEQISDGANRSWRWTCDTLWWFCPKSQTDWGLIGLVMSFVLLGVGFWVSLRKRGDAPDEPALPAPQAIAPPDET